MSLFINLFTSSFNYLYIYLFISFVIIERRPFLANDKVSSIFKKAIGFPNIACDLKKDYKKLMKNNKMKIKIIIIIIKVFKYNRKLNAIGKIAKKASRN